MKPAGRQLVWLVAGCGLGPAAEPPVLTRLPLPTLAPFGSAVVLTADAESDPALRWRWLKDEVEVPGASAAVLVLPHAGPEVGGEYRAVAINEAGETWSPGVPVALEAPTAAGGHPAETWDDARPNAPVYTVVRLEDGSVLVGGAFTQARNGLPANRLLRLRPNGREDPAYRGGATGPAGEAVIHVLAAGPVMEPEAGQPVVVGGDFQRFDGDPAPCLVRLRPDGERDATFAPELPAGVQEVRALIVQPDGRVVVAGRSRQEGVDRFWLVRLFSDGRQDAAFAPPSIFNGRVRALARRADGGLWVVGNFFRSASDPRQFNRVVRLTEDGAVDPAFQPPVGSVSGANLEVRAVAALPDGGAVVSGVFNSFNGVTRYGLAKLDDSGALDETFQPAIPDDLVLALAVDDEHRVYAAGEFSQFGTQPIRSLARLEADGSLDETWQPPALNGPIGSLVLTETGLLCGGAFTQPHQNVVKLATAPRLVPPAPSPPVWPREEASVLFDRPQTVSVWLAGEGSGAGGVADQGTAEFPVTVTEEGTIEELRVWLDMRHPDTQTLRVELLPPPEMERPALVLIEGSRLRHGADFRWTLLSRHSVRPLEQSAAPYTGTHAPAGDSRVLHGQPWAGRWALRITDTRADGRAATVERWALELYGIAPAPDFSVWVASSVQAEATFERFAFAAEETVWHHPTRRFTHGGWAADGLGNFRYWFSTDLVRWAAVTPQAVWQQQRFPRKWFTLAFPETALVAPCGWWRVESRRSVSGSGGAD